MKLKWFVSLTFFTVLSVVASASFPLSRKLLLAQYQPEQPETKKAYQAAIIDAADTQPDEVLDNLTMINRSNSNLKWDNQGRVLVATFTTEDKFKREKPIPKEIWVTVVPELKDFCSKYQNYLATIDNGQLNKSQLNELLALRLKQLLGLPPEQQYTHIAEIFVHPQYLKRPSLDPEINDSTVEPIPNSVQDPLPFGKNADQAYQEWFKNLVKNRSNSKYPWTGLGYTYDWSPKTGLQTDAGLSEFVILLPANSEVISPSSVKQVLSTKDYCKVEE